MEIILFNILNNNSLATNNSSGNRLLKIKSTAIYDVPKNFN